VNNNNNKKRSTKYNKTQHNILVMYSWRTSEIISHTCSSLWRNWHSYIQKSSKTHMELPNYIFLMCICWKKRRKYKVMY